MKRISEDHIFDGQLKVETDAGVETSVNKGTRPYKVYTALLTQSGTNAPVATIFENSIGDAVWSRDDVGYYKIVFNEPVITYEKLFIPSRKFTAVDLSTNPYHPINFTLEYVDTQTVYLSVESDLGVNTDSRLNDFNVEIRVYP